MVNCKDVRQSLGTTDLTLARHRLRDLRADLEQTGASGEQLTLRQLCERYLNTTLHRVPKTVATKRRAYKAVLADWPGGPNALISNVRYSQVETWLASYKFGAESHNHYLKFIRATFALARCGRP